MSFSEPRCGELINYLIHGYNGLSNAIEIAPGATRSALCRYGGHIGFWTPFNGCWTTQSIIKFFARPEVSSELKEVVDARSREGVRRRNSLDLATKLRDTSLTHLTDYSILLNQVEPGAEDVQESYGDDKHVAEKVELFRKTPKKYERKKP